MPQLSPMNWLVLFLYFSFVILTVMVKLNFVNE